MSEETAVAEFSDETKVMGDKIWNQAIYHKRNGRRNLELGRQNLGRRKGGQSLEPKTFSQK